MCSLFRDFKEEARKEAVRETVRTLMDRVMEKVLRVDPFLPENFKAEKPLYDALVPHEIFRGSHFERRFVTPFGKIWQDLAQIIGESACGEAKTEYRIVGQVRSGRLERINSILRRLEHGKADGKRIQPDWVAELDHILEAGGELRAVEVICDLYVRDTESGKRLAFELKAPLPNSDQTKVSKEKLFKLYAMEEPQVDVAFYTLPYNPYGRKEDYAWSFPKRWFNMVEDNVVLIGDEFWDLLGGEGTLQTIIDTVQELGDHYKPIIRRDYLGIQEEEC